MAVAPLNLLPELEGWQLAGLTLVLLEPEQAEEVRAALERPARKNFRAVPAVDMSDSFSGWRDAAALDLGRPYAAPASVSMPERQFDALAAKERVDLPAFEDFPKTQSARPAKLPALWETLLARSKPAPLAWTYVELGQDLSGQGSPERSQALRGIISALRLKKGTSAFWPVCLPESMEDSREFFHYGLDSLGVRYLVIFGGDALKLTDYARLNLSSFTEQVENGRLILMLPGFADLLASQARLESATSFLRSVFSRFAAFGTISE